jgi:predicted transposase/invertase (TIGR01784 family)
MPPAPPFGLGILQLRSAPESQIKELASHLLHRAKDPVRDRVLGDKVIELVEEVLVRRYTKLSREEIRAMFPLADIRNTRVWREIYQEGQDEGVEKGLKEGVEKGLKEGEEKTKKNLVIKWLAKGMSPKDIAELMEISVREVRRLAKDLPQ